MKFQLTEDQSWALIYLGVIMITFSMVGFAWVTWPDSFTGLVKTVWDLLTSLIGIS